MLAVLPVWTRPERLKYWMGCQETCRDFYSMASFWLFNNINYSLRSRPINSQVLFKGKLLCITVLFFSCFLECQILRLWVRGQPDLSTGISWTKTPYCYRLIFNTLSSLLYVFQHCLHYQNTISEFLLHLQTI